MVEKAPGELTKNYEAQGPRPPPHLAPHLLPTTSTTLTSGSPDCVAHHIPSPSVSQSDLSCAELNWAQPPATTPSPHYPPPPNQAPENFVRPGDDTTRKSKRCKTHSSTSQGRLSGALTTFSRMALSTQAQALNVLESRHP